MAAPSTATEILKRHAAAVEQLLYAPATVGVPARLADAMAYSLKAGGKRLRPALLLESAVACGATAHSSAALTAAAAIEMVHTFSLIHDDLPAMDDDDLRRGRPTNHRVFGDALAILAGDALSVVPFELLTHIEPAELSRALARELAQATGPAGMIGGQVLDMEGEGQSLTAEELGRLHALKTGALLTASVRMGGLVAGAADVALAALTLYGSHVGLAFQVMDDVLDVTASAEAMGKATGKDAAKGKNTYPALLGLDAARSYAVKLTEQAVSAVEGVLPQPAGLIALARFVVNRAS